MIKGLADPGGLARWYRERCLSPNGRGPQRLASCFRVLGWSATNIAHRSRAPRPALPRHHGVQFRTDVTADRQPDGPVRRSGAAPARGVRGSVPSCCRMCLCHGLPAALARPRAREWRRCAMTDVNSTGLPTNRASDASSSADAAVMPLKVGTLLIVAISVAALLWAGWATITLMDVRDRRIVTVGLADLMADFIEVESRRVGDPETAKMRTAEYLAAVDRAVAELAEDGTTVLVAEAVDFRHRARPYRQGPRPDRRRSRRRTRDDHERPDADKGNADQDRHRADSAGC